MRDIRIALAGGGTGGHVFPIIAIARSIRRMRPDIELRFIGPVVFGRDLFEQEGIPVTPMIAGKIHRYATPKLFLEFIKMPLSFLLALWHLFWFMPDLVFGKGGYGMVPVAAAARVYRIPVVIHESDAIAGLATRIVARMASQVLTSFPVTSGIRGETICVGNPVRGALTGGNPKRGQERFKLALQDTVLVLGGSQGAESLNSLMLRIAPDLVQIAEVIHQVGAANEAMFTQEKAQVLKPYPDADRFYHAYGFLDEEALADAYAVATVVVARAGSGLIFELAEAGLPTILVPLTTSAQGHQYANAEAVAGIGGALLVAGDELTPNLLLDQIKWLLSNKNKRQEIAEAFRAFAKPDAAERIAQILLGYLS